MRSGCGGVDDAGEETPEVAQQIEATWDAAVTDAENLTRMINPGKLPASMRRNADGGLEKPKVNWRTLLRRFVDRASLRDYSFSRPNRRHIAGGILLPGRVPDRPSHIVAIIDTSGSINEDMLKQFKVELQNMLDDCAMDRLTIGCADTHLNREAVVSFVPGDLIKLLLTGGGGTDFRDAFGWATKELDDDVTAIVYFTDMCTSNFGDPGDIPVVWAIDGSHAGRDTHTCAYRAPFGEKIWLAGQED